MTAVVAAAVAADADADNLPLNQSLLGPLDSRGLLFFETMLTMLIDRGLLAAPGIFTRGASACPEVNKLRS